MAQRIQVPLNGITTTSTYMEGDTCSLVNLRPKNGALHPVAPRKKVQELSQGYELVFIHQNSGYKNWIGVVNKSGESSVYWKIRDEQPEHIASIEGIIHHVEQIGNTLSLITTDHIYYMLYRNGGYAFLGQMPELPPVGLRTSDQMARARLYFSNEYKSGTITADNFIEATKGLVNKAMDAIVNGYKDADDKWVEGKGLHLFDACFIRYAFRLYDGSLTKHSPPVLILPTRAVAKGRGIYGEGYSIKSILYFSAESSFLRYSYVDVYGYRIYMHYDFTGFDHWKDIIQSVDIFLSAPLGISNIENIRKDMVPIGDLSSAFSYQYDLIKEISSDALKNVANTSSFYFMKSIPLGAEKNILEPEAFPSSDSEITRMENLIHQELMTDDPFSHHTYGAASGYVYNNRLHLADVKTTFSKGFNPACFLWYNTMDRTTDGTITGNYNGYDYAEAPGKPYSQLLFEVEINTGSSVEKVYKSYGLYFPVYKMFLSGFLSYPDPRAIRLTIYRYSDSSWYRVFSCPLEKHNTLNLSYYVNDGLKPICEIDSPKPENPSGDLSKAVSLTESNKLKVSELNNPLVFPVANTYQVGTGSILALATNAMNVSDWNYGQYPLYVFTTRGVWTLNVGSGEVVYSTQTAPSYTEAPISGVIGETPYGAVFATKRGLYIINGKAVDFISPQLEQKPAPLNIEMNASCDGVVFPVEHERFSEALKDLAGLVYNPYEDELIIHIKGADMNYVLNFSSRQFYQSTEKMDILVENAFPELLTVDGVTLKDYACAQSPLAHVGFILRPLQYGTPDIKRLERMILNALLYQVTHPAADKFPLAMVHYSNDGVNFRAAKGYPIAKGNRRNFDMGLFARTKSNRFLYTFAGMIDERSQLFYIDTVIDKEYNHSKMR